MTKTGHTPWTARPSGGWDGLWTVEDAQGGIVFFGMEKDVAHLFAAAPEMLEVLKHVAKAYQGLPDGHRPTWHAAAVRAIALAEGRASLPTET